MPRTVRNRALLAVEPMCHYCGAEATTADHIIPQSAGGPSAWWNLVSACQPCNSVKGADWPTHGCERCKEAERLFILGPREVVDRKERLAAVREPKTYGSRTYWRSIARGYQPYTKP